VSARLETKSSFVVNRSFLFYVAKKISAGVQIISSARKDKIVCRAISVVCIQVFDNEIPSRSQKCLKSIVSKPWSYIYP